jgi:hypothetical protein
VELDEFLAGAFGDKWGDVAQAWKHKLRDGNAT